MKEAARCFILIEHSRGRIIEAATAVVNRNAFPHDDDYTAEYSLNEQLSQANIYEILIRKRFQGKSQQQQQQQ